MQEKFIIELRVDLEHAEDGLTEADRRQIMNDLVKMTAQQMFAGVKMMSLTRDPKISVRSNDFFAGTEEIDALASLAEL